MNVKVTFSIAILAFSGALSASQTFAQGGYAPDRPVTFGAPDAPRVNFMHHRSTELGDALDGLSLVIESQGRFERLRSEAIVNLQQAERLRLQNLVERERAKLAIERQKLELQAVKAERQRLSRQLSIERQARMKPVAVVSSKGSIDWIEPLKAQRFAAQRQQIESTVQQLFAARSLEQRERLMDEINFYCQEFIETLASHKSEMSANAYDSSRRFINRLYDDLQQPTALVSAPSFTSR